MITILGATGNIGSKVIETLLAQGHKVRAIARTASALDKLAAKGVETFAGSAEDVNFLTKAFTGSKAVLVMLSTDFGEANVKAQHNKLGESVVQALKKSGVQYVVNISSIGGHTEEKTGIVAGLARQEKRLNALEGVNVLHLRPAYFFENLLGNIGMIKGMGINGSAVAGDVSYPMVATRDIAVVAAKKLAALDFTGKSVLPVLGPKDYSMNEITKAIGAAIGKPDLNYVQFPYDQAKQGMMGAGMAESVADAFVEMSVGINTGVFNTEVRSTDNTTPTTIEEFATSLFAHVYNAN
jgi:uncharacterized protein YbjT (DUF2867 family)